VSKNNVFPHYIGPVEVVVGTAFRKPLKVWEYANE